MDVPADVVAGFDSVAVPPEARERALHFLGLWLTKPEYAAYVPQIQALVSRRDWAGLLDRFYRILPFGTGGRRGAVGIGPNRMNAWTLGASVQGHCVYLRERFTRGEKLRVVVAFDVRRFEDVNRQYDSALPNPVLGLSSKALAHLAAGIYAANGVNVHVLAPENPRLMATPELSYCIRALGAHGGLNLSASHNPPDDNGGKFYDDRGAQPVPPEDQLMADLVEEVDEIRSMSFADAVRAGKITYIEDRLHREYLDLCRKQSLVAPPKTDDFKVVFTPLHGVGGMTAMAVLQEQGFRVVGVESQMTPDGRFPNVTKSPNPEVPESMDKAAALAAEIKADLVLATDPDADRLGAMAPDSTGSIRVVTGNQIAALLTHFKLAKLSQAGRLPRSPIVVRTEVTTSLISRIARHFNAQLIDDLLVGFKYVAEVLRRLETDGRYGDVEGTPADFVLATEESHGAMLMPQMRDKDAGAAALLMAEIALDQKRHGRTVHDYIDELHERFGYFRNEGVSIYMKGIEGNRQMAEMMDSLRAEPFAELAGLPVTHFEDLRDEDGKFGPLQGATDAASRNVLLFRLGDEARVAIRPSGTEPKAKAYVEVCSSPRGTRDAAAWAATCAAVDARLAEVQRDLLRQALGRIGMEPPG